MPTVVPETKLGARLRELRVDAGLSQWDLARKLGTQPNRISNWELGNHEPKLPQLRRIAEALDTTVARILEGVM